MCVCALADYVCFFGAPALWKIESAQPLLLSALLWVPYLLTALAQCTSPHWVFSRTWGLHGAALFCLTTRVHGGAYDLLAREFVIPDSCTRALSVTVALLVSMH